MIKIEEYILKTKVDRQAHLELSSLCEERGCNSTECKGLLAYILDTTVPSKHTIYLCHACNNDKCSNPFHLYWGTPTENFYDAKQAGSQHNIWEKSIAKHGEEKARTLARQNALINIQKASQVIFGKIWITNGISEKLILKEEINNYPDWQRGRASCTNALISSAVKELHAQGKYKRDRNTQV
jgi:hypothetical protein